MQKPCLADPHHPEDPDLGEGTNENENEARGETHCGLEANAMTSASHALAGWPVGWQANWLVG